MKEASVHIYHGETDTSLIKIHKFQAYMSVTQELLTEAIAELAIIGYNLTFFDHYSWEQAPTPSFEYIPR